MAQPTPSMTEAEMTEELRIRGQTWEPTVKMSCLVITGATEEGDLEVVSVDPSFLSATERSYLITQSISAAFEKWRSDGDPTKPLPDTIRCDGALSMSAFESRCAKALERLGFSTGEDMSGDVLTRPVPKADDGKAEAEVPVRVESPKAAAAE